MIQYNPNRYINICEGIMKKAYFNWSSGKHSAMALYYAIKYGKHEVLSLFTIDKNAGTKIAMHEIGIDL